MNFRTFLRKIAEKTRLVVSNVTIEPARFLLVFSSVMDGLAISQMTIYKSCRLDFGYNDSVCSNLIPDYPDENEEVQEKVAQFHVYQTWVDSIAPIFLSFFLGAWADMFGRRMLFYIFLVAKILSQVCLVFCAFCLVSAKEWMLLANVPLSLSGGYSAFYLATNAFIADITPPDKRALRYGMLNLAGGLALPLAAPAGAFLLKTGGYACVMTSSLVGLVISSIYLIVRINQYKWKPLENRIKKRNAFSPLHIRDCFTATFRKRQGPNRKYLLILFAIMLVNFAPFYGEIGINYNYVRTRFGWEVDEYSTYNSIVDATSLLAKIVFIPLVAMLNVNESLLMTFILLGTSLRHLIRGLATEPWMYYFGAMVDIVGTYGTSIAMSMLSATVPQEELGKVSAVELALENSLPVVLSQAYTSLWAATDRSMPGAVFLMSAGISLIPLTLSAYVLQSLRGNKFADITANGAGRTSETSNSGNSVNPYLYENRGGCTSL